MENLQVKRVGRERFYCGDGAKKAKFNLLIVYHIYSIKRQSRGFSGKWVASHNTVYHYSNEDFALWGLLCLPTLHFLKLLCLLVSKPLIPS